MVRYFIVSDRCDRHGPHIELHDGIVSIPPGKRVHCHSPETLWKHTADPDVVWVREVIMSNTPANTVQADTVEVSAATITCGPRYDIFDPHITGKLDVATLNMDDASGMNDLATLDWWLRHKCLCGYSSVAVDSASGCGYERVLDWWARSGLEFRYTANAMDIASSDGFPDSLDWWVRSKRELRYTSAAVDGASAWGHADVLRWWFRSGLELRYTRAAFDDAAAEGRVESLEEWKQSGLEMKFTVNSLVWATTRAQIAVLDWLRREGFVTHVPLQITKKFAQLSPVAQKWWRQTKLMQTKRRA